MKITPFIVGLALLVGLLIALGCWTWTVMHTFAVSDPWWRSLPFYRGRLRVGPPCQTRRPAGRRRILVGTLFLFHGAQASKT
jgi:hypothetical protein